MTACKYCPQEIQRCTCGAVAGEHWVDDPWAADGPGQLCRQSVRTCPKTAEGPYQRHEPAAKEADQP